MNDAVLNNIDKDIRLSIFLGISCTILMVIFFFVFRESAVSFFIGLMIGMPLAYSISEIEYNRGLRDLYIQCEKNIKEKESK